MRSNKYLLIVLIPLAIILVAFFMQGVKTGKIAPGVLTSYGSVIFTNRPEGIKCYDRTGSRVEFDYSSVVGSSSYSNGYLTLKADDGIVDKITCSVLDNNFIEVKPASPTEGFEDAGFRDYGPIAEDESVTYEYHITVVGGLTWSDATTKSISISCTADLCDTTVGLGSCDFNQDIDFYNSVAETCS